MKEQNISRVRRMPDGKLDLITPDGNTRSLPASRTDWKRLESMTEKEVVANAISDPDNQPLTAEQLAGFRPVPNPKVIRVKLHMTQQQFAEQFGLPLGTLRDWEQHLHEPDAAARNYLRVIAKDPEAVIQALRDQGS